VGSDGCLQAVGTECGLIGGDCGLTGSSVGAECEPKTPLVCEPMCRCLQAATASGQELSGEKLFKAFCKQIKLILTAASSQIPRNLGGRNGLALALLKHLRHIGILKLQHWQDVYGSGREDSKLDQLIEDFVHFVVAKGFEHGAANHASDPIAVNDAQKFITEVNTGRYLLQQV
jgi:hypothetical protein